MLHISVFCFYILRYTFNKWPLLRMTDEQSIRDNVTIHKVCGDWERLDIFPLAHKETLRSFIQFHISCWLCRESLCGVSVCVCVCAIGNGQMATPHTEARKPQRKYFRVFVVIVVCSRLCDMRHSQCPPKPFGVYCVNRCWPNCLSLRYLIEHDSLFSHSLSASLFLTSKHFLFDLQYVSLYYSLYVYLFLSNNSKSFSNRNLINRTSH